MNPFRVDLWALKRHPPAAPANEDLLRTCRSLEDYRIEISGELTLDRRDRLAAELEKALEVGVPRVVLDLTDVEVTDRSCVHTILMAHLRAGDQLQELLIVPGRETVTAYAQAGRARPSSPTKRSSGRDSVGDIDCVRDLSYPRAPNRGAYGYHRVGLRHGVSTVTGVTRSALGIIFSLQDSR